MIVAKPEESPQATYEELKSYADRDGDLVLFRGWSGYDLSSRSDDGDLRFVDKHGDRSLTNRWAATVSGGNDQEWNKNIVADHLFVGGPASRIIGSTKTVAYEMET